MNHLTGRRFADLNGATLPSPMRDPKPSRCSLCGRDHPPRNGACSAGLDTTPAPRAASGSAVILAASGCRAITGRSIGFAGWFRPLALTMAWHIAAPRASVYSFGERRRVSWFPRTLDRGLRDSSVRSNHRITVDIDSDT